MYAVTARHIIDMLRKKGVVETVLRLNPKTQDAPLITVIVPLSNWFVHPSDGSIDATIIEMGIPSDADHLVMPISLCATEKVFLENEVELGEEVFVSGLFRHHYGNRKKIPIIRVGNLAALSDEKISTKSFGEIEGYLIEARSAGGLSGSPAFLNLGPVRQIGGEIKYATGKKPIIFLLGLIHGHFVLEPQLGDKPEGATKNEVTEAINAGIAIVVPAKSILSVIEAYEEK